MLQIQNHQTLTPSASELHALRESFEQNYFVRLAQLLEPTLLAAIQEMIHSDLFDERVTPKIGSVESCADPRIDNGFQALMNQPEVRATISAIIAQPVDLWAGATVRRVPGRNHFSNWHNDLAPPIASESGERYERVAPMSLNVSTGPYEGGNLEIQSVPDHRLLADVPNPTPGDAILFAIGEGLRHRVADVTGGHPRMVHVGWFHRRLD
ncbi:MAG: 2OG-Fe(II) oxygenase [Pseudomonadota bacterium]